MGRLKTQEEYVKELQEVNPKVEVIGIYVGANTKIKHKCLIDGHEWDGCPHDLLRGHGCPICAGNTPYTTESFKEKLKATNPNIEVFGEYINSATKIKCRCLMDGYEWDARPNDLLRGHGCPRCANRERYTSECFKKKLKTINPNIEILEEYIDAHTKIKCRCLIDGYEFYKEAHELLRGCGCPVCSQGNSYMQMFIYRSFKQVYDNILYRSYALIGMELDIIIPDIKLVLEPGSWYWHKDKIDTDLEKRDKAISKGYNIITIYDSFNELEKPYEDCITFDKDLHRDEQYGGKLLENFVKDLFKQLDIEQEIDFDKVREECKILC